MSCNIWDRCLPPKPAPVPGSLDELKWAPPVWTLDEDRKAQRIAAVYNDRFLAGRPTVADNVKPMGCESLGWNDCCDELTAITRIGEEAGLYWQEAGLDMSDFDPGPMWLF